MVVSSRDYLADKFIRRTVMTMSRRDLDKMKTLLGYLRLLFITPGDVKRLWRTYILPIRETWRWPVYSRYDDDDAYDMACKACESYRKTFKKVLRRTIRDKHCGRSVFIMIAALLVSVIITCIVWKNIFDGRFDWARDLFLSCSACIAFIAARNASHNIKKCVALADKPALADYRDVYGLDNEPEEPEVPQTYSVGVDEDELL